MKKHLITTLLALAGLGMAQSASAIIAGGVDFGANATQHLETSTIAETFITDNGQELFGYGQINTVNGNIFYGTNPNTRLYFVFDQYISQNFVNPGAEFSGGEIRVYLAPNTVNLLLQDSPTNFALIETWTPWVKLVGHDLDGAGASLATLIATGPNNDFTGSGDLDVVHGWGIAEVEALLDSNGIIPTGADIGFTSSGDVAVNNTNDVCTFQAGQWCIEGSADLRGVLAVPEPGTLALLGISMLGLAGARRRKAGSIVAI